MAKIAIISTMEGFPWGGSEYLWVAMAEQALVEGHEVFVSICDWTVSHPLIVNLQKKGAHLLARPRFFTPLPLSTRVIRKLIQLIPYFNKFSNVSFYKSAFDYKPDIICISHSGSYDTVYTPDLLNLVNSSRIPYFVICQFNSDSFVFNSFDRSTAQKFFNQATQVAFVSQHNLKLAERQLAQSLPNAVVVQNPVNLTDHSLVPFPFSSTVSFASVARLDTSCKGQDLLLEALSYPIWQERNWQCCFYGSGPDIDYLKNLAHHYNIADRVKFMGHLSDVRSIWSENHLLVLTSRAEGTPLALVEAMLCGRPALVTNVGGNTEWIEEFHTGFVAKALTANDISSALEKAWLAKISWKEMGVKAHEYAIKRLDNSPGKTLINMLLKAHKTSI